MMILRGAIGTSVVECFARTVAALATLVQNAPAALLKTF
jgi:hypothetical protein